MTNPEHLQPSHPDQAVVLLAEDDALVQNIVRIALEGDGYFVLTAHDGQDALEISRQYPSRIDLLLTDYAMPRLDGMQLVHALQRERPAVKVLLMSGDPPPHMSIACLPKPFKMQELLARVQSVLPDRVLIRATARTQ